MKYICAKGCEVNRGMSQPLLGTCEKHGEPLVYAKALRRSTLGSSPSKPKRSGERWAPVPPPEIAHEHKAEHGSFGPALENAGKTHCKRGHPLSGSNLFIKEGRRQCRTCHNERGKKGRDTDSYRAWHAAYERERRRKLKENDAAPR